MQGNVDAARQVTCRGAAARSRRSLDRRGTMGGPAAGETFPGVGNALFYQNSPNAATGQPSFWYNREAKK